MFRQLYVSMSECAVRGCRIWDSVGRETCFWWCLIRKRKLKLKSKSREEQKNLSEPSSPCPVLRRWSVDGHKSEAEGRKDKEMNFWCCDSWEIIRMHVMNSWKGIRGERRTCAQNKTLSYTNECKDEMNTEQTSCQEVSLQLNASLSSFFPMHYEEVKHHLLSEHQTHTHRASPVWSEAEKKRTCFAIHAESDGGIHFLFQRKTRCPSLSMVRQCIYLYLSFPFSLSSLTWTSWCNHTWTTQSMKK